MALLGEQHSLDVGQDPALGDGHAGQQLVQLLVVPDGQLGEGLLFTTIHSKTEKYLKMSWNNPGLLIVPGGIPGQLQDLCREVLHHGRHVDGGSGTNTGGVIPFAEEPGIQIVYDTL